MSFSVEKAIVHFNAMRSELSAWRRANPYDTLDFVTNQQNSIDVIYENADNDDGNDDSATSSVEWHGGRGVVVVANKLDLLCQSVQALLQHTLGAELFFEKVYETEWMRVAQDNACAMRVESLRSALERQEEGTVEQVIGVSALEQYNVERLKTTLREVHRNC